MGGGGGAYVAIAYTERKGVKIVRVWMYEALLAGIVGLVPILESDAMQHRIS